MLKQIAMFKDLHVTLLKFLAEKHIQVNVLDNGECVKMKDINANLDYIYVYRGKLRIKMEHVYGKHGPRGGEGGKPRYSTLTRGQTLHPLNVTQYLESGKDTELNNQRIARI